MNKATYNTVDFMNELSKFYTRNNIDVNDVTHIKLTRSGITRSRLRYADFLQRKIVGVNTINLFINTVYEIEVTKSGIMTLFKFNPYSLVPSTVSAVPAAVTIKPSGTVTQSVKLDFPAFMKRIRTIESAAGVTMEKFANVEFWENGAMQTSMSGNAFNQYIKAAIKDQEILAPATLEIRLYNTSSSNGFFIDCANYVAQIQTAHSSSPATAPASNVQIEGVFMFDEQDDESNKPKPKDAPTSMEFDDETHSSIDGKEIDKDFLDDIRGWITR